MPQELLAVTFQFCYGPSDILWFHFAYMITFLVADDEGIIVTIGPLNSSI